MLLFLIANRRENFFRVEAGFDLLEYAHDLPVRADEECPAHDAHVLAAHELLFLPYAVGAQHLLAFIGEQRKIEFVALLELGLLLDRVGAATENGRSFVLKLFVLAAKLAGFDGSTGCAGFGIEKDDNVATFVVA